MDKSHYIFKSKRLGFRLWQEEDIEEFSKLNSDKEVMEYFPDILSKKEVKLLIDQLQHHYKTNGFTYYATEILDSKEFIGMIGIALQEYKTEYTPAIDIGWRLKRSVWGKGYATEGAKRCLEYAFNDLKIDSLISVCVIDNKKSEHIMSKIGMFKIGEFNHPKLSAYPKYEKHVCYRINKLII